MSKNRATADLAIRLIDSYKVDTTIYTDGSCQAGTEKGGSAVVITTGTAANPVVLKTIQKKGGAYTCSYQEEKVAMEEALKWMKVNQKYSDTVICSDSQSLLTNIEQHSLDTVQIRSDLDSLYGRTSIHWIPSHINIPGNEYADAAAKEATKLTDESNVPVSYEVAKALIKRTLKDDDPIHPVVAESYKNLNRKQDRKVGSRKDAAMLAQLRSGHCLELAHYKNRIDQTKSAICNRCELEEETVKHWISCPATRNLREKIFGKTDLDLGILTSDPEKSLAFAGETLRK